MVLVAKTEKGSLSFHVDTPVTDEELRRLRAIQEFIPAAEWTGRKELR
jgi:hypothetical protein